MQHIRGMVRPANERSRPNAFTLAFCFAGHPREFGQFGSVRTDLYNAFRILIPYRFFTDVPRASKNLHSHNCSA